LRQQLLSTMLETAPGLVVVCRLSDLKIVYLNATGRRRLNRENAGDLLRLQLPELIGLASLQRLQAEILPQAKVLGRWAGECELRDGWGSEFRASVVFTVQGHQPDQSEDFLCLHALERPASGQAKETHFTDRHLLHALMNHAPDAIYFKDSASRFLRISRALAKKFGLNDPSEAIGKTDFDMFSAQHAGAAFADEQTIMRTGRPIVGQEEMETWENGRVTWCTTSKLPLCEDSGKVIGTFGISRDITARKQAEDRSREQAEVIDQTPIAIIISDLNHRVIYCNAGAVELYGIPRENLVGRTAEEILTAETLAHLSKARQETFAKGRWTGEITVETKGGRQIQVEFHMSLIHDAEGRPKARLSVAIDVTEKKKLEAQFLRAQRLESLGMLAAGIAHDLNNVLVPVLMGAPLLRVRATHPSDLRVLETMETSAGRGAALVRQILSFAHGASGEKSLIQVKHLLHDIAELIQETFPKSITLEDDIPNNLWTVLANPTQIHQVLLNLCVNARDAMPQGGTLRLRAENRVIDGPALQQHPGAIVGSYLVLEVTDTGTGIAPGVLTRIWDPFFTTKCEDKGTGLGLATVRGIAASHGGFATVESEPGHGSTFSVFLPAAEASAAPELAAGSAHPFILRGQGELILVVDDETPIRDMISASLGRFGYRVVAAANGFEAMAIYTPRLAEIALVVTDLSMPGMGGGALAAELSRLNPAVKILFMTGADGGESVGETVPVNTRLLIKPFTGEKLLSRVHEALVVASVGSPG
jgi:PAS domain S-box-containing protein